MKNLRVILLKKSTTLGLQKLDPPPLVADPVNCWIAQGRFDAIWSCKPPTEQGNVFWRMHKCNEVLADHSTPECYYHPLYLLSEEDDSDFWRNAKWFLAIVRIHFSQSVPKKEQYKDLSEKLRGKFEQKGCRFQPYKTAELSDMVLGIQSDSIQVLLTEILNLRRFPEIGRVYTYLGVYHKLLKDNSMCPEEDDKISFCSMRFAVHAPEKVYTALYFIKDILGEEATYAVIGVDDIAMNWKQLSVKRLIALYRFWYQTATPEQQNVFSAFSSITTRMGVTLDWGNELSASGRTENLKTVCDKLVKLLQEIRENVRIFTGDLDELGVHEENSWLFPLYELTIALSRLSQTSVLDEFAYLMLPAAAAFLRHIRVRLRHPNEFKELKWEDCALFVESWNYLMEHIMRTEGQLTQLPQVRPILYDIPLTILEYMLAFLERCIDVLRCDAESSTDFLIVPKQCGEIVSMELFRARKTDSIPGLVLISIPLHKVYRTGEVQLALCHEVSHFVGETYRLRDKRIRYYAEAVGTLMEEAVFQTHSEVFREACMEWIWERLSDANERFMRDMEVYLKGVLEKIFSMDGSEHMNTYFSDLIYYLLCKVKEKPNAGHFTLPSNYVLLCMACEDAFTRIEQIGYLFTETIADIFMMLILDLPPKHYAQLILRDLWSGGDPQCERAADRIYICLTAIGKEIPNCSEIVTFAEEDIKTVTVDEILTALSRGNAVFGKEFEGTDSFFCNISSGCIKSILAYAQECARVLKEDLEGPKKESAEQLQKMFRNMRSLDINYTMLQEDIAEYRKRVLNCLLENFTADFRT